jgi:hypothetical protein
LVGRAGDRIIVETSDGPAALDPETGKLLWFRGVKDCLATRICGPKDAVLTLSFRVGRKGNRGNASGVVLSWFNPEEGTSLASAVMDLPTPGGWHVGPLVGANGRQWLAMAPQQQPAQRQMLEALRTGDAETP